MILINYFIRFLLKVCILPLAVLWMAVVMLIPFIAFFSWLFVGSGSSEHIQETIIDAPWVYIDFVEDYGYSDDSMLM
jgi:hypothetical protein